MVDGHPIHNKDPYNGYYKSLWTIGKWTAGSKLRLDLGSRGPNSEIFEQLLRLIGGEPLRQRVLCWASLSAHSNRQSLEEKPLSTALIYLNMIQTKYFSTYQSLYARVLRTGRKRYIARKPSKSLQRCETNLGCTQNRSNVLGFTNTTLCTAQLQTPCHNTLRERFLWKSSFSNFFQTSVCSMSIYINTLHMNLCLLVPKFPVWPILPL